jgi:hypothetical protein
MSGSTPDFEGPSRGKGSSSASIHIPLVLLVLLLLPQCQTVPATVETRLSLIYTAGEIQLGLGAFEQVYPELEGISELAGIEMRLLFLKFSREDELEAAVRVFFAPP